jgi:hypothetical protein
LLKTVYRVGTKNKPYVKMKMNFEDITGALNRDEMKKIMAGSGGTSSTCTSKTCQISSTTATITVHCYTQYGGSGCYCYGKTC